MSQLVDYNSFDKKIIDRIIRLSYKFRYIECDTERNAAWTNRNVTENSISNFYWKTCGPGDHRLNGDLMGINASPSVPNILKGAVRRDAR